MKTLPVLALLLVAPACTKDPAPKPPEQAPEKKTENPPEGSEYAVSLAPRAPYAAGKEATVVLNVTAKQGYHVNPDYPMAFKPQGHSGVTFAEPNLKLTWGPKTPCAEKAEDTCAVEVPIALTPEKAGPAVVAGLVSFSVCNPQNCRIEKLPLSLPIDVQ